MNNRYYVYQLIDPRDNKPFYVGKGTGYRMTSHLTEAKQPKIKWSNAIKCERIQAIWNAGLDVITAKVADQLTEEQAYTTEIHMISSLGLLINGTGILTNIAHDTIPRRQGNQKRETRCVVQYSMDGDVVAQYQSASAAAINTSTRVCSILDCCKGKTNYANNYRWAFKGDTLRDIIPSTYHTNRRLPVEQYSISGELVAEYPSAKFAAEATGLNIHFIRACCNQKPSHLTAGGYVWRHK